MSLDYKVYIPNAYDLRTLFGKKKILHTSCWVLYSNSLTKNNTMFCVTFTNHNHGDQKKLPNIIYKLTERQHQRKFIPECSRNQLSIPAYCILPHQGRNSIQPVTLISDIEHACMAEISEDGLL